MCTDKYDTYLTYIVHGASLPDTKAFVRIVYYLITE